MELKDLSFLSKQEASDLYDDMEEFVPRSEIEQLVYTYEERIKELKANQSKWISVNDRLPNEGENVLCINKENEIHIAFCELYEENGIQIKALSWLPSEGGFLYDVTHWMPLPPPPTEENTATEKEDK